jgi:hypothetical protein
MLSDRTRVALLSPETVERMAKIGHHDKVVAKFLDRYCRRCGPISCLDLSSDPDILPRLPWVMREIA